MLPGSISRLIQEGASSGRELSGGIVTSSQTQREVIMNGRKLTVLTTITGILALGEFGSSVMIWRENYPGSLPLAAVVFGVFFLIAAWLLRSGRVTAGAIVAGVLCLFEVVSYPGWQKHGALDWTYDTAFGVVALAGLIGAITVLAGRLRRRAAA
jgi:hypothetical protein